jgi:hypothetical protein
VHSSVGETVGTPEGKTVGTSEGKAVGGSVGSSEGEKDGTLEGEVFCCFTCFMSSQIAFKSHLDWSWDC